MNDFDPDKYLQQVGAAAGEREGRGDPSCTGSGPSVDERGGEGCSAQVMEAQRSIHSPDWATNRSGE